MNAWLAIAATLGFLAVALGAFGAHGLQDVLDARGQELWQKAVLYQMFHAGALLAVAILHELRPRWRLGPSGVLFTAGTVVFSGTLYLLAVGAPRWLGAITPVGGVSFLAGWLWLLVIARRRETS